MLCNYIKAEQARVQEHAEPSTLCTVEFRCPQCQPRQAIDADDAEDSMDEDVNADGLNRQEAFSAEDDDRAQDARNIIATQAHTLRHLRPRITELTQHTSLSLSSRRKTEGCNRRSSRCD